MKTLLITGASAGFGQAMTRHFAGKGDRVIAVARRAERLAGLAAEFSGRILPLALDIRDKSDVVQAVNRLPAPFHEIDVLVNNAGLALGITRAYQTDIDDWETMIATNCSGLAYITHAVLPSMVERRRGKIINLGSIAGEFPYPGGNVYGATKAFVHQFTNNLNADLIGSGVTATCIEPGLCGGTEFSNVRFKGNNEKAAELYRGTQPLTAEDIVDVIDWVVERPHHVTISQVTLMPNCQSFAPLAVDRRT